MGIKVTKTTEFDENRRFGVEIEFTSTVNKGEVARRLRAKGVDCKCEGYNHTTRNHWKIVTDATCGHELVSPPLKGREGLEELRKACDALNEAGAEVDRRCGVHVHHDVNDFDVEDFKKLFALYIRYEDTMDSMVPPSRRLNANNYCRSLKEHVYGDALAELEGCRSMDDMMRLYNERYLKLNIQSYRKYGTVEFRQHSGSTEYKKISSWILLTSAMVTRAKDMKGIKYEENKNDERQFEYFKITFRLFGYLGASEELQDVAKYYTERRKELAA